jgi:cytochrome c-type biogenesis protein CcmH/NrfG
LGETYLAMGERQKAREALLQAQQLAPTDEQLQQLLRQLP